MQFDLEFLSESPLVADIRGVGKTNFVILVIGLMACVLLSLMMQHAVKVQTDERRPRVLVELEENFSFEQAPTFQIVDGHAGQSRVAELEVHPQLASGARRLVRSVGDYVWRNALGDGEAHFDALVVTAWMGEGRMRRFQVPHPRSVGSLRLLADGEEPRVPGIQTQARQKASVPVAGKPDAPHAGPLPAESPGAAASAPSAASNPAGDGKLAGPTDPDPLAPERPASKPSTGAKPVR